MSVYIHVNVCVCIYIYIYAHDCQVAHSGEHHALKGDDAVTVCMYMHDGWLYVCTFAYSSVYLHILTHIYTWADGRPLDTKRYHVHTETVSY
jgi:hypothetical protein